MAQKNRAEPRPRTIEEQYDLYWKYEHYAAARAYLNARGLDLSDLLKEKYNPGTFSNWKNEIHPFDLDKIAAVMLAHNILWGHVPMRAPQDLKRVCLARTIDFVGSRAGAPKGGFTGVGARQGGETDGLAIIVGFLRSSRRIRAKFLNRYDDPEYLLQATINDMQEACPIAANRRADDLTRFVRTWVGHFCDAVSVLSESFPEYADHVA